MARCFTAKRLVSTLLAAGSLILPGCADGHLNLFGYTTEPPYDCNIQTVFVPIPQNATFRRGLEFDLHRAIVREIELKTPYRVARCDAADSVLDVKIVSRTKTVINVNQNNEVRDAETTLAIEAQWKDLRPGNQGEVLNTPPLPGGAPLPETPLLPPPPPPPVLITASGNFIPELGGSLTSAEKQMIDKLAVQIVSIMEKRW